MRAMFVGLGLLVFASASAAQRSRLNDFDLPRDVERRLRLLLDDSTTRQFYGASRIETDQVIDGNVITYDGPLVVAGRINGELVVIGGDVVFLPGSTVTRDVTVIGGEAVDLELASLTGTFTSFGEGFELFHRGERVLAINNSRRWRSHREEERYWGRSNIALRTGINYNRVEGLPILFGPVLQTGGRSPTRLEAFGILRTGAGGLFNTETMGYEVRAEQFIDGRTVRVGGLVRSVVEPIESWSLTKLEASLATFMLHDDQRDYFDRSGWGAYVRVNPRKSGLDASIGYWDEDHSLLPARDPWTLFGDGAWRAQPLVAEGRLQAVSGRVEYDARDFRRSATSGFLVGAQATRGVGGNLVIPARGGFGGDITLPPLPVDESFTSGLLDVRLYGRVGRHTVLALRGVSGGSIDGQPLPPQFQHALGGAGTLPGYSLFRGDCGARLALVSPAGDNHAFYPSYGCDRFALGTIEYRGGLNFDIGGSWDVWGHSDEDWNWHMDASPNWMVFFNAGRGWAVSESRTRGAFDTEALYDAGAGIMLGGLGIYTALPLTGEDRSPRFFVRLGARF
jgi:hypothetical protein